ncbi:hypothetical protein [Rhizobium ruizarguesonis]|uniref:hypothetical protein n=1 Tax=Rhizobium ruizarguesonis TaxID=2081791 RepID=UPI0010323A95|nr:hypothetical protein [Rhizobium ruizarguesonis]NEH32604.1 hypothetical protein [Rhizobium ruizarguesonis]NEK12977.1 hypothetical protein [Rhizobium ruizarguesonis]TBD24992.1 hypothetical protein ELH18_35685 [Rhizobium ruizarguesonis]TBD26046.1 hypothetical protein ELH19_34230 [Rhizobium ruizarguesonis]TBD51272.1 hypothetical protein ELH15_33815 [Rhizobium ruizarguesonis]
MHHTLETQLTRRALLAAAAAAITEAVTTNSWAATAADLNFYASRSGRFGSKRKSLIIGGILAPAETASQLETQLHATADELGFRIPLRFSTNSHNPRYYKRALSQFMALPDATFAGVRISTPNWPVDRTVWQFWRTSAEEKAFRELTKRSSLTVTSLRHDFDADIEIYKEVDEDLPLLKPVRLLKSYKHGSRLMDLASCICKSLDKPERLNSIAEPHAPNSNKYLNDICRYTYDSFSIGGLDTDISTVKLTLKNIST